MRILQYDPVESIPINQNTNLKVRVNPQPETHNPTLEPPNQPRTTRNMQHATRNSQPVYLLDLGLLDYQDAWALQQKLVSARVDKKHRAGI